MENYKIKLGDFIDGGDMVWHPLLKGHQKLSVIGEGDKKMKIIDTIEKQIESMDVMYFKVEFNNIQNASNRFIQGTLSNIVVFEKEPESYITNKTFAKHRKVFVDLFVKYVTTMFEIDRRQLVISYRPTLEGALCGYIRAAEKLEDEKKEKFKEQINLLEEILWNKESENKFSFEIKSCMTRLEQKLEFLKAIWSFWVFAMLTSSDIPMILKVEIPDNNLINEDSEVELQIILSILEALSSIGGIGLIVVTSQFNLLNNRSFRYKLMLNNQGEDYDLKGSSLEFDDSGNLYMMIDDVQKIKMMGKL